MERFRVDSGDTFIAFPTDSGLILSWVHLTTAEPWDMTEYDDIVSRYLGTYGLYHFRDKQSEKETPHVLVIIF